MGRRKCPCELILKCVLHIYKGQKYIMYIQCPVSSILECPYRGVLLYECIYILCVMCVCVSEN